MTWGPLPQKEEEDRVLKLREVRIVDADLIPGPHETGQTYTVTNVTTDRTYDANATSVAELADVLGTLIADLRTKNVVD